MAERHTIETYGHTIARRRRRRHAWPILLSFNAQYTHYCAPSPGSAKEESLEEFIKRTGKVPRPRTKFRRKTIPNRGTHNRKSPFLSGGSASTWYQKVPLGGRAERSATRTGRSQDKELQKISRRVTKNTMPDNR